MRRLTADNHATLASALARPQEIRGYGPVKDQAAARVKPQVEAMVLQA